MSSKRERIGQELLKLASTGASAKDIIKDIKSHFPDAKKKDVMEAAFRMVIEISSSDPDNALRLQALALDQRGPSDD